MNFASTPAGTVLDVFTRPERTHTVVTVQGEIDAYSHERLRRVLIDLQKPHAHTLVIDLADVPFMDSSGLGVLVGAYKRARSRSGAVCLLSPDDRVLKLLAVTGLNKVIVAFDDLEAALDHLDAQRGGAR